MKKKVLLMALLTLLVCFCLVFTACDSGETNGSTNQNTSQSSTGGNTQNSGDGSDESTQGSTGGGGSDESTQGSTSGGGSDESTQGSTSGGGSDESTQGSTSGGGSDESTQGSTSGGGSDESTQGSTGGAKQLYTRVDDDTILFGEYPQAKVTDTDLQSTLNSLAGDLPTSDNSYSWTSYGYYISGSVSNYMWYIDVENGGERYRGVYFTSYRPYYCSYSSSTGNTYQDDNGYTTSNIYWFKYEPISWTILNENNGTALILCDMIIDSQQFDYENGSYYNDYAESTIRKWLNETFYNTAFDELQKEIILTTTVDNSVASTGYSSNQYACEDTEDKVFLLSYQELTTYLTTNASRMKKTTDYAQSQGACISTSSSYLGNGYWWLRSPYYGNRSHARDVNYDGGIYSHYVSNRSYGVVPALQIQL